jgi:hypothetical protein
MLAGKVPFRTGVDRNGTLSFRNPITRRPELRTLTGQSVLIFGADELNFSSNLRESIRPALQLAAQCAGTTSTGFDQQA